ncbi:MAG: rhodanese-like domain-containing protein [Paracoccaceae bacterium]
MFNFLRPASANANQPSLSQIADGVAKGEITLVDVREAGEVRASGKAKGALNIPLGVLQLKADPSAPDALLRPGKPVALYCASGGRSGMAAQMLQRMGYAPVWNIGGLGDWHAAGGQVERS